MKFALLFFGVFMCGIAGIYSFENINVDLLTALTSLQHRGQDAAGVLLFNKKFLLKKGLGLVKDVFNDESILNLNGNVGIGHVRYTTQGENTEESAQPMFINYPIGIGMAHNGNVTNTAELKNILFEKYHYIPKTTNDLELLLYLFTANLNINELTIENIFESVKYVQSIAKGAYSVLTIISDFGMLAFTDNNGIRPLLLGKKEFNSKISYCFSSESSSLDLLNYNVIKNMKGSEIVFIDKNFNIHSTVSEKGKQHFCIFEYIYFSRADSIIFNKSVAAERIKMGKLLANQIKEKNLKIDVIVDVPKSGYFAAVGLSEELNIPHKRALIPNDYIGRSFILPKQSQRESVIKQKFSIIKDVIENKNVALVDDSIVRGTTAKYIVKQLKNYGAKNVYLISAAPPLKFPCFYGINISTKEELIANKFNIEELKNYFGADDVIYQDLKSIKSLLGENFCEACFTGKYQEN